MPVRAWNGVTIGVNVESTEAVDETFRSALAARAVLVGGPVKREWGGYSGYFADPEGNDGRSPGHPVRNWIERTLLPGMRNLPILVGLVAGPAACGIASGVALPGGP